MSKLLDANKKIEKAVVGSYKKIKLQFKFKNVIIKV